VQWLTRIKSDQDNVTVIKKWQDGVDDGKIPTAILFDENQQFKAFGNTAVEKYKELVYDGEHEEKYFFRDFKMELYDKAVSEKYICKSGNQSQRKYQK